MRFPDIQQAIADGMSINEREPDGLLHASKHIWWPLRFSQLEFAGHPMGNPEFLDLVNMQTGTLWHKQVEEWLKKDKTRWWELVASEVDLTDYLPNGWTGTADWVFYDKEADHCILGDLKTIKPEAVQHLSGIKDDHLAQLSCYNFGLTKAGYTMAPELFVFYLPKNKIWTHDVKPQQLSSPPIDTIEIVMTTIKQRIDSYVGGSVPLASMPDPVYKYTYNKLMNVFDVKSYPDWRESYTCPFDEKLCPRTPIKKVGHWNSDRKWVTKYTEHKHRKYPRPTDVEFRKRGM